MEWTQQPYLPTISGLDVTVWVAAYVVWRYLTGLGRVRRSAATANPVRRVEMARPPMPQFVAGRWGHRAAMLEKMGAVIPPQVELPRDLRRAA
jgi:hypothetical protein